MIKSLIFFFMFPFYFAWHCAKITLYLIYSFFYYLILLIGLIIDIILKLFGFSKSVLNNTNYKKIKKYKPIKKKTCVSSFEKEASLWGLTKEDKKRAKEEMMSPSDFIEAEENDDDLLDNDD